MTLSDFEQIAVVTAGVFVTLLLAGLLCYWIVREGRGTARPPRSADEGDFRSWEGPEEKPSRRPTDE